MDDRDLVGALMAEIGPAWDAALAASQVQPDTWLVELTGDRIITATSDAATLTLSIGLGLMPAEHRERVAEALLCGNLLVAETGGFRFGLVPGDDGLQIEMAQSLATAGLTLELLLDAAMRFAEEAADWQRFIDDPVGQPQPPPAVRIYG